VGGVLPPILSGTSTSHAEIISARHGDVVVITPLVKERDPATMIALVEAKITKKVKLLQSEAVVSDVVENALTIVSKYQADHPNDIVGVRFNIESQVQHPPHDSMPASPFSKLAATPPRYACLSCTRSATFPPLRTRVAWEYTLRGAMQGGGDSVGAGHIKERLGGVSVGVGMRGGRTGLTSTRQAMLR
jgi:hypothetical protein